MAIDKIAVTDDNVDFGDANFQRVKYTNDDIQTKNDNNTPFNVDNIDFTKLGLTIAADALLSVLFQRPVIASLDQIATGAATLVAGSASIIHGVSQANETLFDAFNATIGVAGVYLGSKIGDIITGTDDANTHVYEFQKKVAFSESDAEYDAFYASDLGKIINQYSDIKYNDEASKLITSISKFATEATAITAASLVATPAAAAGLGAAFTFGDSFSSSFNEKSSNGQSTLSAEDMGMIYARSLLKASVTAGATLIGGKLGGIPGNAGFSVLGKMVATGGIESGVGAANWGANVMADTFYYGNLNDAFNANGGIYGLLTYTALAGIFGAASSGIKSAIELRNGNDNIPTYETTEDVPESITRSNISDNSIGDSSSNRAAVGEGEDTNINSSTERAKGTVDAAESTANSTARDEQQKRHDEEVKRQHYKENHNIPE